MDSLSGSEIPGRSAATAHRTMPFVHTNDQFPANLKDEHDAQGYRYISITAATKRRDAVEADKQNMKVYKAALQSQRQQDRFSARTTVEIAIGEPPRPNNTERFDMHQASMKKVEALPLAIAVHNLTACGKIIFRDYMPQDAVALWARLEREIGPHGRIRSSSYPSMPIPIPGMPIHVVPGHAAPPQQSSSYPGETRIRTPPPPGYAKWGHDAHESPTESPHAVRRTAPPPEHRPAPDAYLAGRQPAGWGSSEQ